MTDKFRINAEVAKVNEELGVVFGWALVCTEDGKPSVDLQNDVVSVGGMLKAAMDFSKNSRAAKEMHRGAADRGEYVFLWPVTKDICGALGIECAREGLLVGLRPDEDMLEKFKSGELRGFSIGGRRVRDSEITIEED